MFVADLAPVDGTEVAPNPADCSFDSSTGQLIISGVRVPYIHYKDDYWTPAKLLMRAVGECNITHFLERAHDDDKKTLSALVMAQGMPQRTCGLVSPLKLSDPNQGKAFWINESGFWACVMGSRRPEWKTTQRWVTKEVLPAIRRTGQYVGVSGSSGPPTVVSRPASTAPVAPPPAPKKAAAVEDKKLNWTQDLGAARHEVPLAKATFRQLLELEIAAGALPASVRKDCSAPSRNQQSLAAAAVESARAALVARKTTTSDSSSSKKRKTPEPLPAAVVEPEPPIILKISEILQEARVWKPVRRAIASDLANRMLQLKTETTDGKFSARRTQHLPSVPMDVEVHLYTKTDDVVPLAEQALRDVQPLYEKRIREFLEAVFSQFDLLSSPVSAACTVAARRLADDLCLDLSGLLVSAQ